MKETLHNFAAGLHERLLDGQLDAEGRHWLAQHRASCTHCDRTFDRLERITRALEELEPLGPTPGFADRVLAEVRPAPLPTWARWRLTSGWQRLAASFGVAVLVAAGLAVPLAAVLAGVLVAGEPANVALFFQWPDLAVKGLVAVLGAVDPFQPLLDVVALLGGVTRTVLFTPQGSAAVGAGVLLSAGAFRQLAHLLATPATSRG